MKMKVTMIIDVGETVEDLIRDGHSLSESIRISNDQIKHNYTYDNVSVVSVEMES